MVVCEPAGISLLDTTKKPKVPSKAIETQNNTPDRDGGISTPRERVKARKIISQVRGYESENENSRDSTATSGSLVPQIGVKLLESPYVKELS